MRGNATDYFPRAQVPTTTIQLSLFGNVGCSGAFLVQTGVTQLLECTFIVQGLLNFTFFLSLASLLPKMLLNVTSLKRPSLLRDCCFQISRTVVKRRNVNHRTILDVMILISF